MNYKQLNKISVNNPTWVGLVCGACIVGVLALVHPRLKLIIPATQAHNENSLLQATNAQELWAAREFSSIGTFSHLEMWPKTIVTQSFPISELPYSEIVAYQSSNIDSLEIFLTNDSTPALGKIFNHEISINNVHSFDYNNLQWVIALFDRQTAETTNGLFDYSNDAGHLWLHISVIGSDDEI